VAATTEMMSRNVRVTSSCLSNDPWRMQLRSRDYSKSPPRQSRTHGGPGVPVCYAYQEHPLSY
jgi:hypothetical protein